MYRESVDFALNWTDEEKINYIRTRCFCKGFYVIRFSNLLFMIVPDEGYSGKESCTLNYIYTFLL